MLQPETPSFTVDVVGMLLVLIGLFLSATAIAGIGRFVTGWRDRQRPHRSRSQW